MITGIILVAVGIFFLGLSIGGSLNHFLGGQKCPEVLAPELEHQELPKYASGQFVPLFTSPAAVGEAILNEEDDLEGCASTMIAHMETEWWARRGVSPDDDENGQVANAW